MAPNTFVNINDGQRDRIGVFAEWEARWNPQWISLLGIRSDNVLMNTGTVQGYNNTMMYNGAPLYPATTFNARDRKRTDNNIDVTALSRYTPSHAGIRGRIRHENPFAEPLRALRVVDKHDGHGDGQLRRRWQLLHRKSRPEAGSGPYRQRDRQLA